MDDERLDTSNHLDQEEFQNDEHQRQNRSSQQQSELDDYQDDKSTIKSNSSSEDDSSGEDDETIDCCTVKNDPKKCDLSLERHRLKPRGPIRHGDMKLTQPCNLYDSFTPLSKDNSSKSHLKYWISTILVIMVSALAGFSHLIEFPKVRSFIDFSKSNSLNHDQIERIDKFLNETRSFVPDIGQEIFQAVIHNVYSSSESSIILLLIGNSEQGVHLHDISQNLANLIVELKQEDYDFPTIQLDQHYTSDMIEQQFDKVFNKEQRSVMVLEHLESLPSTVTTTFHQFVDNNQSKIRKSFTIITLEQNFNDFESIKIDNKITLRDLEKSSTKILQQLWSNEVRQESLDCLINRFAEYSIILLP